MSQLTARKKKPPFYITRTQRKIISHLGDQISQFLNLQSNWNNTRQTIVDIKYTYVSYSLGYLKYLNKYALTTNIFAYVKYVNTFVCQNYLHKIVVLCISISSRWKWICRTKLSYKNSSDMQMYSHMWSMHSYLNI